MEKGRYDGRFRTQARSVMDCCEDCDGDFTGDFIGDLIGIYQIDFCKRYIQVYTNSRYIRRILYVEQNIIPGK